MDLIKDNPVFISDDQIEKLINCPIICYYHFKEQPDDNMSGCTTNVKFENDLKTLLSNEYTPISLQQIWSCIKKEMKWPKKPFCLIFFDGFESNYTIAFDILKRNNVHVDIFLSTDLMETSYYSTNPKFIPRLSWKQAKEMYDSGLVSIHGLWHESDEGKGMINQIAIKRSFIIKSKLGENNFTAFFNSIESSDSIKLLYNSGIDIQIIKYGNLKYENMLKGCLGYMSIDYKTDIYQEMDNINARKVIALNNLQNKFLEMEISSLKFLSDKDELDIAKKFYINKPKSIHHAGRYVCLYRLFTERT
jgi:hypothetical protein